VPLRVQDDVRTCVRGRVTPDKSTGATRTAPVHHFVVVSELVERGIGGPELLKIVECLTGLPTPQAIQLIAYEQGVDSRDAVRTGAKTPQEFMETT